MKKPILPVISAVYPYLYLALFALVNLLINLLIGSSLPFALLLGILVLSPVIGVCGFFAARKAAPEKAAGWGLTVKLCHIPFYLLVCFLCLAVPMGAVFFFVFDVLTLISGTGYGIAAILRAWRAGTVTTGWAIVHILCHCIFVLDVISAFLLWKRLRKAETE